MAYTINNYNGEQLIVLEDGTLDTSTSVNLVGRNYVGYGEAQNENFVWMLENFANDNPPSRPLKGQLWFDSSNNLLHVYDGSKWNLVGSAILDSNPPPEPTAGALWLKTPVNTLNVYDGVDWRFIGPEAVPGFGTTRCRSGSLIDSTGTTRPVIFLEINANVIAISTPVAFTIDPSNSIANFENNLIAGINLSSLVKVKGDITGRAGSADRLHTPRFINGTVFDGQSDITVKAATLNRLMKGTYITGANFDGSNEVTWSVDATSNNTIGKIVARDSAGDFSAGTISATFSGTLLGNVNIATGTSRFNVIEANQFVGATLTGNAFTASKFETKRKINGVDFDGTANITVPAAANTLTTDTLAPNVVISSLTSVGTLTNLSVADAGVAIGSSGSLRFLIDSNTPTIRSATGKMNFDMGSTGPDVSFVDSTTSLSLGGPNAPAILGDNTTNLGIVGYKFNNIYANNLVGNADTATLATRATNIVGGGAGAIPYQTAANTTTMLGLGAVGTVLTVQAGGTLAWSGISREPLTKGNYLTLVNTSTTGALATYDGTINATLAVDATSNNTASKVVARDSSGNFSAGTITATLSGNVTGNVTGNLTGNSTGTHTGNVASASTVGMATNGKIQWPNDPYGGSGDVAWIDVYSRGGEKLALRLYVNNDGPGSVEDIIELDAAAGVLISRGNVTSSAAPTSGDHLANKTYVDSRVGVYTFTYGQVGCVGYTNQVGSFNNGTNYFDVFPPAGKGMGNLVAFIPSLNTVHYAGGVDGNDSIRTQYQIQGDRIRVWVQNTEQRSTPAGNYLAIWS